MNSDHSMTFYDRNFSPWNKRAKWSCSINSGQLRGIWLAKLLKEFGTSWMGWGWVCKPDSSQFWWQSDTTGLHDMVNFPLDQWSWHYGLCFHIWISWTLTVMITDHNSSCYELIIIAMNWQQIMYENGDHSYELLLFIVWYFGSWLWNAFDHGWKKWSLLWTPLIMWSWLSYSCHHESYHDPYR